MELYLGSIIEPIRKSIRNTLYFNSKHASKTLGEAMQKAQDLHIKHLYVTGEDQESVTSSNDVLPEITINEVTPWEDRGWYKNKREFREHSHNSREISPQRRDYTKRVTFNQTFGTKSPNDSEYSDSSRNLRSRTNIQGTWKRQVGSAAKCDTRVFYTNNGESNAVTRPPVHSMVR